MNGLLKDLKNFYYQNRVLIIIPLFILSSYGFYRIRHDKKAYLFVPDYLPQGYTLDARYNTVTFAQGTGITNLRTYTNNNKKIAVHTTINKVNVEENCRIQGEKLQLDVTFRTFPNNIDVCSLRLPEENDNSQAKMTHFFMMDEEHLVKIIDTHGQARGTFRLRLKDSA